MSAQIYPNESDDHDEQSVKKESSKSFVNKKNEDYYEPHTYEVSSKVFRNTVKFDKEIKSLGKL